MLNINALPWAGARSVIHGSGPPRSAAQASKATLTFAHSLQMVRCSRPLPAPLQVAERQEATRHARRYGGGKVANRPKRTLASSNWFCGKRLTRPRSAILCAAMRLQIGGTQRCFNNILSQPPRLLTPEACCSTSAARKLPTPWGVCCCNWHAREAINNGANDNIKRKRLRMLLKTCVLGRCCPEAQGAPTVVRGCAPQWRREAPQGA